MCVTVQLHLESVKASLRSGLSPTLPVSPLPSLFTTPFLLFQHCTNWQLWTRLHTLGNMCTERERDRKASSAFCAAVAAAAKAQTLLLCPRRRLSKRCQSKSKRKIAPLDCCVVFKIGRKKIETTKKIEIIFFKHCFCFAYGCCSCCCLTSASTTTTTAATSARLPVSYSYRQRCLLPAKRRRSAIGFALLFRVLVQNL